MIGMRTEGCLVCGCRELAPVLDLGTMALTGLFPATPDEAVPAGPLELVRCTGECGLVQLRHVYPAHLLYGDGYGYRSGLNVSMVEHLRSVAAWALARTEGLGRGDIVLDIGSNDGTLLSSYAPGPTLVGIDPTIRKFGHHYRDDVQRVPDFFTADLWRRCFGRDRAKLVTSIAMFYDLVDPVGFASDVAEILAPDGVWITEQSYLPTMLERTAYDTVCHEHLEYYGLRQIDYIARRAGLQIIDAELTETNGGSCIVALSRSRPAVERVAVRELLSAEANLDSGTYERFASAVSAHRSALCSALDRSAANGLVTFGYGASTKGNVILQHCGLTAADLPYFAEVNEEKFGRFTPGSGIPIVAEQVARAFEPDQYLVMPWHFRAAIVAREQEFLSGGGGLMFPLPEVDLVKRPRVSGLRLARGAA